MPALERQVVVWYKSCFGYDRAVRVTREKVWYERDGKAMKYCLQDLDGYELMSRDECTREMLELAAAVGGWLRKKKNRKEGWQIKCTIAAGEKAIIEPHSQQI